MTGPHKVHNSKLLDRMRDYPNSLQSARLYFFAMFLLALISLPDLLEQGRESGRTIGSYSWLWVILVGGVIAAGILSLVIGVLLFGRSRNQLARGAARLTGWLVRLGAVNALLAAVVWAGYVFVFQYRYQTHFSDFLPQVWVFWLAVGVGAVFITALQMQPSFFYSILVTGLLYGFGVKALGYLPDVTSFPFSLNWSEASRYYYASLPYAERLYGLDLPLSFMHPSRYLLQGIAYWLPGSSLLVNRLWQVILWLALPLATGAVFARRFSLRWPAALIATVWAALFLYQGPVYYHLLVCVIPVLWGLDRRRFWKTMVVVVFTSVWAGISRVNWFPVPAFLAALLYLMEAPVRETGELRSPRAFFAYFWKPAAWGAAGGLAALAAQAGYVFISGYNDASAFGSTFSSALLWYRLLPSPTYAMGVLPSILIVVLPAVILAAVNAVRVGKAWHPVRMLAVAGMGLVLFVGGLVVSTKIGGGSNIHNLDAFIVYLMVTSGYIWADRFAFETIEPRPLWRPWPVLLLLVVVPVVWNLDIGDPFVQRDSSQASYDLQKLRVIVEKHSGEGEVLFITQRQLQIFDLVPETPFVADYELLTLSEMSISHNQEYLDRFHADLANHRFALIVADRQSMYIKNPKRDGFAEEHNAWVVNVAEPLMKYYDSELFFDTQGIDMLVPRR